MSQGLSSRTISLNEQGRHFTDDSKDSERVLSSCLPTIRESITGFLREQFQGKAELIERKRISIYDLMMIQHKVFSDLPVPDDEKRRKFITPDGGIWFLRFNDIEYPIMIIEDKKQGTNDSRFQRGDSKQSLGNAIERFAKNVRVSEMLFQGQDIFPYVMFASGCDFHPSETISERISSGNYGFPNNEFTISRETTDEDISNRVSSVLETVDITKKRGLAVLQCFTKSHKWNEMNHRASDWKADEIIKICSHIARQSILYYVHKINAST